VSKRRTDLARYETLISFRKIINKLIKYRTL
jgi:hypothetical protein